MAQSLVQKTPPDSFRKGKYLILNPYGNELTICYNDSITISNNTWQVVDPLARSLPIYLTQVCATVLFIRLFTLLLKPARQPRFMAELLTSILLGSTFLEIWTPISLALNPYEGAMLLEVMANLGLTYYMFVVGLEMDLTPVWNCGKTALYVALSGVVVPLFLGPFVAYLVRSNLQGANKEPIDGVFFWGIALTVTSFSDLARILSDLKLLHTELGKVALSAAVISDVTSWALLVALVSSINGEKKIFMVLPTLLFIVVFWVVVRPFLTLMIRLTASNNEASVGGSRYSDMHVVFILAAVPFFGFLTDLCGSHSMVGAFLFGLIIPPGELGTKVMDMIEEYVVGIMLPPFFLTSGLRTNLRYVFSGYGFAVMCPAILFNIFIKPVSVLLVSIFLGSSIRDSLALAVLMNTKGVLAIIILNEGRSLKGFDQPTFGAMILSIFLMTGMVGPIVSLTHKSTRNAKRLYLRSIEKSKPDSELRILLGVHSSINASSLLNMLQISNAQRKSPVTVFAVHLVELTGRASAMLIFHDCRPKNTIPGNNTMASATREKAEAEKIISAFESFERDNPAVAIQPLTAVSSYTSMHQDISQFALDKRVTLILLPFHKQPTANGGWKDGNVQHRQVNQNLLSGTAPCSVGIFVDRGLSLNFAQLCVGGESSSSHHGLMMKNDNFCRIAMLFIGGPDDREALAYAWRMAGCENVTLTVVRFFGGEEMAEVMPTESSSSSAPNGSGNDTGILTTMMESEKERQLDADYINEFRFRTMYDKSIMFVEKQVNSADQTLSAIVNDYNDFELYVVGRGQGLASPLTAGLSEWSEYPELGPIGEALISSEFISQASVLVLQQSAPLPSESKKHRVDRGFPQPFVNHRMKDDD